MSQQTVISLPVNKWVGEEIISATFGLTSTAISNYRLQAWTQGVHYRKIGLSNTASARRAKVLYNLPALNEWIEGYPQI